MRKTYVSDIKVALYSHQTQEYFINGT